jgi:hypothetical protein
VGACDGTTLGACEGDALGASEGDALGACDGANVSPGRVGLAVLGASEGTTLGACEGASVEGEALGACDGAAEGVCEGATLGAALLRSRSESSESSEPSSLSLVNSRSLLLLSSSAARTASIPPRQPRILGSSMLSPQPYLYPSFTQHLWFPAQTWGTHRRSRSQSSV